MDKMLWNELTSLEEMEYKFDIELSLGLVADLIAKVEKNKLTNSQWFLNFLDKLNKLSTKY